MLIYDHSLSCYSNHWKVKRTRLLIRRYQVQKRHLWSIAILLLITGIICLQYGVSKTYAITMLIYTGYLTSKAEYLHKKQQEQQRQLEVDLFLGPDYKN